MPSATHNPEPERYLLISSPRTASNLLVKILNPEGQGARPAQFSGYFFLPPTFKRISLYSKPMKEWTREELDEVWKLEKESFDKLQDHIEQATAEGQRIFVKEHALLWNHPRIESETIHGEGTGVGDLTPFAPSGQEPGTRSPSNKTVMSDEYLLSWKPTILIRHPAMVFPSLLRKARELDFGVGKEPNTADMTMRWARAYYDFYREKLGEDSQWPIVLEADDIMTRPDLVTKYAGMIDMDPEKLRFSWDVASKEQLEKLTSEQQGMLSSLNASTKIDLGKLAGEIDIEAEGKKWQAEFGEESGRKLVEAVMKSMPDYEFLRTKRLQV